MSVIDEYVVATRDLARIREIHEGKESQQEDTQLDMLLDIWERLTEEEILELDKMDLPSGPIS